MIPLLKYRYDNIYPFIGFLIGVIINLGGLFWWGGRLDLNQQYIIANQLELKNDFKSWKIQAETRIGELELSDKSQISHEAEVDRALHLR